MSVIYQKNLELRSKADFFPLLQLRKTKRLQMLSGNVRSKPFKEHTTKLAEERREAKSKGIEIIGKCWTKR